MGLSDYLLNEHMNEPDRRAIIGLETKWVEAQSLCQASVRCGRISSVASFSETMPGETHGLNKAATYRSAQLSKAPGQGPLSGLGSPQSQS